MEASAPDTHATYTRLVEVFTPDQAEALVDVLPTEPLATKAQLEALRQEFLGRFTGLEGRFTGLEGRFVGLEGQLALVVEESGKLREDLRALAALVDTSNGRLQTFSTYVIVGMIGMIAGLAGIIISLLVGS